jgi:hypothetical protein
MKHSQYVSFCVAVEWGGNGGKIFESPSEHEEESRLKQISLYCGTYFMHTVVCGIELQYFGVQKYQIGNCDGSSSTTLILQPEERIVVMSGRFGSFLDSLTLTTNKNRSIQAGGNGGKSQFTYYAPEGSFINGFHGAAGACTTHFKIQFFPKYTTHSRTSLFSPKLFIS